MPHRFSLPLVALLLAPLAASAAGLGRLTPLSLVGDPLHAEIEIVSLAGEEESLAAKVAPAEVYHQVHATAIPRAEAVRLAIERKADGRHVIRVSSTEAINQPLVNLLIELSWAGGRVVRQYSFLLDASDRKGPQVAAVPPPVEAGRASALPDKPAAPERDPDASRDLARAAPAPAKPAVPERAPEASGDPARAPSPPAPGGAYAVQSGDTLAKIAQAMRHEGVTVEQTMVAIYRANESAFVAGNMNRLKAGRTLTIPDRDVVVAIKPEEARQVIAAQRYVPDEVRSRSGAAAPAGPEGDDAIALDRALAEARDRASALEQTLTGLRQVIEARDREIADIQRELGDKGPGRKAGPGQPPRKTTP